MNLPDNSAASREAESTALPRSRRTFLKALTATTTVTGLLTPHASLNASRLSPRPAAAPITDVNVSLGSWPFRRLPLEKPADLVAKLRQKGVRQAWVGNFDALLHKDVGQANSHLAKICRQHGRGLLLPFGTVHPAQPDWREELHRCVDQYQMRGIRLYPNYHGYTLDDPRFSELLDEAIRLRLIVQLALVMEDERMMHPLGRVAPVDTSPLATLVKARPGLRLVLVNALRTLRARPLLELLAAGNVSVEISMLEGVGGLETLLAQMPHTRVLFGSHAPLFYFESAWLKLQESAPNPTKLQAIRSENARRLLESPA